ncbi:hypothetical protein ACSBR2_025411 [Camellia fascicularis]
MTKCHLTGVDPQWGTEAFCNFLLPRNNQRMASSSSPSLSLSLSPPSLFPSRRLHNPDFRIIAGAANEKNRQLTGCQWVSLKCCLYTDEMVVVTQSYYQNSIIFHYFLKNVFPYEAMH